jgi:hypothetical protein
MNSCGDTRAIDYYMKKSGIIIGRSYSITSSIYSVTSPRMQLAISRRTVSPLAGQFPGLRSPSRTSPSNKAFRIWLIKNAIDNVVRASVIMRNAVDKQRFRNAVTRFVTSYSLSYLSVTSDTFKDMILVANPEAGHVLISAATTLRPRIKR